ncbi:hypothetical protein ASD50_18320 [Mesorhizobium sp. Root552]|uniref:hypothetical protein n=1 Tax=Mesorhizobium sp. Root552 TaxID=1736555 RepID=UPI0006FA9EBD|nr:hypothetical protein [Mesorhizobium sp. Root552]KQZ29147.1 hypothetical protein ASD50_18320 [Mesorhizobium sp. Root552]
MGLAEILKLTRKPSNPRTEIVAALAELDIDAAERSADDLEAQRRRLLVSGDDAALEAIEVKITTANRAIERTLALREELEARLAGIDAETAEADRRARYDQAVSIRGTAEKALRKYPQIARQLLDLLETLASAEIAINTANADRPEGLPEIESVEAMRCLPGDARELLRTESVPDIWCYQDGDRVDPGLIARIESTDGKTGFLQMKEGAGQRDIPVFKRRFERQVFNEARAPYTAPRLAGEIILPGLFPGTAYWDGFVDDPHAILARVVEAREDLAASSRDPRPPRNSFDRVVPIDGI